MKKVFLLKYLLLYSTFAYDHQGLPTAKKISPPTPSPDTPDLPIFTWTNATSLHVTYPDHEEDIIQLHPSDTGGVNVRCLYDGTFSKEATASAVVSGCLGNSSIYITVYTSHLKGTVFTIRDNVTTEEINPYTYTNGEDNQPTRYKRSDFYYYSGEEEYVDLDFDGPLTSTPANLLLKYRLGYDEGIKAHFGDNEDAVREYIIDVATHTSLHMKHSSLGIKIHMLRVGDPIFAQGKTLNISTRPLSRNSLTDVQSMKEVEPIPLIVFCKTDDLSTSIMGVSWPGFKGGACNETKGAAIVKWRSNRALAGVTLAHESGHLTGQFHDFQEDARNKRKDLFDPRNPCEGRGIMSRGSTGDRPEEWSLCSQERIQVWFPNHGQCLVGPNCTESSAWSTPCVCGTSMCLSQHSYCWKRNSDESQHRCLSRMDLGDKLQRCGLLDVQIFGQTNNNYQGGAMVKIENRYFTVEPRSRTVPEEGVTLTPVDDKDIYNIDGLLKHGNSEFEEISILPRDNIGINGIIPGMYVSLIGKTTQLIGISYLHLQIIAIKLTGNVYVPATELHFTVNKKTLKGFATLGQNGYVKPYRHSIYLEQTGATSFKGVIKKKSLIYNYYIVNFMDEYNKGI